ncbi:unnamed protein product [Notodromas monacha]|uniref:Uncharacterized protein n=1 Tax=Notodromas monacha TaxID=399045 RepID=A0A7R9GHI1_9CRUS|nr:unnamed protein product [Notodromas monacha]CAG0922823.1 unnamed protein product [Notodromas monacha]
MAAPMGTIIPGSMKEAGGGREQPAKVWQPWDQDDDRKKSSEVSSDGKRRAESPLSLVKDPLPTKVQCVRNRALEPLGRWPGETRENALDYCIVRSERPIYGEASSSTSSGWPASMRPLLPPPPYTNRVKDVVDAVPLDMRKKQREESPPPLTPVRPSVIPAPVAVLPPPPSYPHHSEFRRARVGSGEVTSMTGGSKRPPAATDLRRETPPPLTVSSIIGSSDPVIDDHFRRSLGPSYQKLFSSPAISSSSEAALNSASAATSSSSVSSSSSNRSSPTSSVTGLSVDDHFAKALGCETWSRIRAGTASSVSPGSGEKPCSPETLSSTSVDTKNLISA